MISSIQNQSVMADFSCENSAFVISFTDPAYVRSDGVIIDVAMQQIHVILHEGYHQISALPQNMTGDILRGIEEAVLEAVRPDGSVYRQTVPLSMH